MKLAPAVLILLASSSVEGLAAPARAQCEAVRKKAADIKQETDAWAVKHNESCTLCAAGSSCREGFERREASRRQLEDWKKLHVLTCPACSSARCTAAESAWNQALAGAQAKHKEKCRRCDFDPVKCDAWSRAIDELKARHEEWKRDHPATCEKCAPPCEEWRRRALEITQKHEDILRKHRERCGDCPRSGGGCDRAGLIKQEWARDRLALWKKHAETCPCSRAPEGKR